MIQTNGTGPAAVAGDLPARMRAWRLHQWQSPPRLAEVPVPEPGPGDVLLRVEAAGLCHSDLHVMDAPAGALPYTLPFTLGHEIAGTVASLGPGVDPEWLGAPVAVHGIWACGHCRNCLRGRENHCLALTGPIGGGLGLDGGLADYVSVPNVRHLVRRGYLRADAAAPLTDAGLTAHHAVRPHLDIAAGGTVVVVGVGGLGHLALQLLRRQDAAVVAVDLRESARALALRLGARAVTDRVENAATLVEDLGRGSGADLVLDFVGSSATLDGMNAALALGGRMVVVGSAGGALEVAKGRGFARGGEVRAPFWGTRDDLASVLDLARTSRLGSEVETFPLEMAGAAYRRLRAGEISGRAVVIP